MRDIPPQVVFEILSPCNSKGEMTRKKLFYLKHGVEEYYVYDPDEMSLEVSIRENNSFREVEDFATWTSPRLNIRFDMTGDELVIYYPDGSRFLSPVELSNYAEQERFLKEQERFLKEQEILVCLDLYYYNNLYSYDLAYSTTTTLYSTSFGNS
ncbi:hypothetical protein BCV64_04180 [Cylindrospermopsis raciborskii MVCC14]|nr:hypothetical protein BCV64_04180 [Cylindrospermopsis raciborskii MVCC14]